MEKRCSNCKNKMQRLFEKCRPFSFIGLGPNGTNELSCAFYEFDGSECIGLKLEGDKYEPGNKSKL